MIAHVDSSHCCCRQCKADQRIAELEACIREMQRAVPGGTIARPQEIAARHRVLMGDENNPTLLEAMRLAATHKMTPTEIRAQRISYIVGMTGFPRERVAEWLAHHEGH